ncbi:M1 family metallopeptidase [Mucilaginibacter sp. RS28]|uniref:M1 family metallopeptidase n=1 Tax=Mucilaginibacter straminoryzae TaxID=2932774 RepID=A0A9X2BER0_9SPHI|nr:M1 family metallopeptidase [Mucilaginibacter straminoryzae]MCJ8211668.1 M1 family metallopeptidase [Mucilaginibacter straminoryzae]
MFKKTIINTLLVIAFGSASAQTLYMPRDIKKAFDKGTRSIDGKPGKNYWQNHGRYNIHVTVAPPDRNIKGTEEITYFNNSPDTLRSLNMKLILNIHKPGAARLSPAGADYLTDGIKIDTFKANAQVINVPATSSTNQGVRLPKALAPHDSVKLNIAWHYQISKQSEREGMIDSTTYYLAYFYPRVSVYDDYNGWDRLPFNDAQEFYNDFNDYTLKVTVPANYVVWATGTLQNANEVLQPEYAKRLEASFTSDSTIHIATAADLAKKNITAQKTTNTWVWTASNITDVALGISNHYVWDAASVVVDKTANRRASMQAAFADASKDFHHSVQFGRNSLNWFSNNWPGVPYPFPKMTAFQGFADMEYPMMVNDSHQEDLKFAQFVQDHEIAHTYFPFYMGINETRYGYMDEGWATTFETLIGQHNFGKPYADSLYKMFRVNRWIHDPATYEDLPVITPTSELVGGMGNNEYVKPSLSYLALKDMLGDELFKKALHTYMDNWHGKHPIPWDYFNSMSSGSGKNLNWFFQNWFFTNYYIDLAIDKVTKTAAGSNIDIKNIGGFAVPFDVTFTYTDGTKEIIHRTAAFWENNQKEVTLALKTKKTLKSVKINGGIFMDADESNNTWGL